MTMPLMRPKRKNPVLRTRLPTLPPGQRGRVALGMTAAALMGMNNVWYPFVEMADDADLKTQQAQLRMNAYATNGGVDKRRFEMYALSASIIGKCHFCIKSHYELLRKEGMSTTQLRDVGRIAAVVNAASQVIEASA